MKIILAQSTAGELAVGQFYLEALCASLEAAGNKVQRLDLPSISAPGRAVTNIASIRLLGTELTADALICLDAVASVLRHPRKLIVLLDDAYLAADRVQLAHERASERRYIANILRDSLSEADEIFALSRFAMKCLQALSLKRTTLLQPDVVLPKSDHARHQGPELLAMNLLDDRQRPELLIACLAKLPEPFRARWIAPEALPTRVAQLYDIARDLGVEQRLAIDVRRVNAGERAYLLAHAAALVELAPAVLAAGDLARQAIDLGVPLITCSDGGALLEAGEPGSTQPASPDPTALAASVLAAWGAPVPKSPARSPETPLRKTGWSPLLKALAR